MDQIHINIKEEIGKYPKDVAFIILVGHFLINQNYSTCMALHNFRRLHWSCLLYVVKIDILTLADSYNQPLVSPLYSIWKYQRNLIIISFHTTNVSSIIWVTTVMDYKFFVSHIVIFIYYYIVIFIYYYIVIFIYYYSNFYILL